MAGILKQYKGGGAIQLLMPESRLADPSLNSNNLKTPKKVRQELDGHGSRVANLLKHGGEAKKRTSYARGGEIDGKGGPKSDSIKGNLPEGSFVVPAENADIAKELRKQFFPKTVGKKAKLRGGGVPVAVSDGEELFMPDEVNVLIENGVNLNALAPNANPENRLQNGGTVSSTKEKIDSLNKAIAEEKKSLQAFKAEQARLAKQKKISADIKFRNQELTRIREAAVNRLEGLKNELNEQARRLENAAKGDIGFLQLATKIGPIDVFAPTKQEIQEAQIEISEDINEQIDLLSSEIDEQLKDVSFASNPGNFTVTQTTPTAKRKLQFIGAEGDPAGEVTDEKTLRTSRKVLRADIDTPFGEEPLTDEETEFQVNQLRFPSVPKKEKDTRSPAQQASTSIQDTQTDEKVSESDQEKVEVDGVPFAEQSMLTAQQEDRPFPGGLVSKIVEAQNDRDRLQEVLDIDRPISNVPDISEVATTAEKTDKDLKNVKQGPPKEDEESRFQTIGGITGVLGATQVGAGLIGLLASNKRPVDQIGTELQEEFQRAKKDALFGLSPGERAAAESDIKRQRANNAALVKATTTTPAQTFAQIRALTAEENRQRLGLTALNERLKEQKVQRRAGIVSQIEGRRRQIFEDRQRQFEQNQAANADLLNAGLSNIIEAQRLRIAKQQAKARAQQPGININFSKEDIEKLTAPIG